MNTIELNTVRKEITNKTLMRKNDVTRNDLLNIEKQIYLEPDEDLRRAITIEELREKIHKRIHCLFANK